jgi:hypothetical protein
MIAKIVPPTTAPGRQYFFRMENLLLSQLPNQIDNTAKASVWNMDNLITIGPIK